MRTQMEYVRVCACCHEESEANRTFVMLMATIIAAIITFVRNVPC